MWGGRVGYAHFVHQPQRNCPGEKFSTCDILSIAFMPLQYPLH